MIRTARFVAVVLLAAAGCSETGMQSADVTGPAALKKKAAKIDVCHLDEETGEFKTLSISANALAAHLGHGDFIAEGESCDLGTCPDAMVDLGRWATSPPFEGIVSIRMRLTFRNEYPYKTQNMTFGTNTFYLASIPNNIQPPVTIHAQPSGVVPFGETFSYDLTVDVSTLPLVDDRLSFTILASGPGQAGPGWSSVVSASFECVAGEGDHQDPPPPRPGPAP